MFVYFFVAGEPRHTLEERVVPDLLVSYERAHQLSIIEIAKWPLYFCFQLYVQLVTQ